jgi:catechol 2,3-dioxygenase-like lactoylglutathione lyase family enzyme
MTDAIARVTMGVADMQAVIELWIERFGLEIVARQAGPDPGLAELWGIPADQFVDQLLVRTPGAGEGWLHFVQFEQPGRPVRQAAAATDLGPKSLDVNCRDMPLRYAELRAAGYRFRSEISEYQVEDMNVREVQMPGHDDTNVVLIEALSGGFAIDYSPAGYAGVTSFVVVVSDTIGESAFYRDVFGLDEVMHHRITGPGIEAAVGLPSGAALDMRLLGRESHMFGRMELIAYEGLRGQDRFPLARAPALGILCCGYAVESVRDCVAYARSLGVDARQVNDIETIFGTGPMGVLYSPAGLRIEVHESR